MAFLIKGRLSVTLIFTAERRIAALGFNARLRIVCPSHRSPQLSQGRSGSFNTLLSKSVGALKLFVQSPNLHPTLMVARATLRQLAVIQWYNVVIRPFVSVSRDYSLWLGFLQAHDRRERRLLRFLLVWLNDRGLRILPCCLP